MQYSRIPVIFSIIAMLSLSVGCTTTSEQNNPASGGFMKGVAGVVGGQYDGRIKKREEQLAEEDELNARLEKRKQELELESAEIEWAIGRTRGRIASLKESFAVAVEQLSDAEAERRSRKTDLEIAQSRLKEFEEPDAESERRRRKINLEIALSRLNEFTDSLDSTQTVSSQEIYAINQSLDEYQELIDTRSLTN